MTGTKCEYNGVALNDCQTLVFEQAVEYDESRTDKLFDRFRIRVAGSVHNFQPLGNHHIRIGDSVPPAGMSAVELIELVKQTLLQPRGMFRYEVGPEAVLTASPLPDQFDTDVNGGPKPISCTVTRVVGKSFFSVEFEIEVALVLCDPGQTAQVLTHLSAGAIENLKILNNRWRITEEIDGNFKRFRTLEGVLRVRHIAHWPHAFRALCVPPLQKGFQRRRMVFTDTPDGLSLHYSILDEEQHAAPPTPAISWEGTCAEISGVGGQTGFTEMAVKLTGPPDVDKKALVAAIEKVIESRINNARSPSAPQGVGSYTHLIEHMAINEMLHEPVVHAHVRVRHQTNNPQSLFNARVEKIGDPIDIPGYDPQLWPRAGHWVDDSPYGYFAKYFQSPCWPVHGVPGGVSPDQNAGGSQNDAGEGQGGGTKKYIFHGDQSSTNFDDQSGNQSAHLQSDFPYTYCKVDIAHNIRDGVMALPVARWGGAGVSTNASVAIIPIHNPIAKYCYTVHAERVGAWPLIPRPHKLGIDLNNIAIHRCEIDVAPQAPVILADGKTRLFILQCKFSYVLERAPTIDELYAGGATVFDPYTNEENAINGSITFQ